jgi:hypothetical protein
MAIDRYIDNKTGLVTFTVTGSAKVADLIAALDELFVTPGFRKNADILWDFSKWRAEPPEAWELRELVTFIDRNQDKRGTGYRVSIVVSRDLDYGLARMFEAYAENLPFTLRIFRKRSQAEAWLKKPV